MKRAHENSAEENEEQLKKTDIDVLHEIQEKLNDTSKELNSEMELAKQKYYVSYFKKTVEKLPFSKDIIDLSTISDSHEGFLKTYTIAKTCVNADIQLKKIMAFNSIYDMITNLAGKYSHDKIIVPNIDKVIPRETLDKAYSKYQNTLSCKEDESYTELHCISYLIQDEIEKKGIVKIPNPIFNRFTQQMTAVSKYITEILKSFAHNNFA